MAAFMAVDDGRILRRERIFRDRSCPLDIFDDRDLITRYRFPRQGIMDITNIVRKDIEHPTSRSCAIPAHLQVLVALRFLAKGDFLSETADIHGISKASASRCVEAVTSSICNRMNNIKLPDTAEEITKTKESFYHIAAFPNTIGAIDGTLIPIQAPHEEVAVFVSRKGYHALNVQAVANSDLRFTNIVVKWPGSVHDSFIFANSGVPAYMEQLRNSWILGDSGYPLKKFLMTPKLHPNEQEIRYNLAHARTRNVIERSFGVLKSRFRCLHKTGGHLPYKPPKCVKIITSCFKLHNKSVDDNVPLLENEEIEIEADQNQQANINDRDGQLIRQRLIELF